MPRKKRETGPSTNAQLIREKAREQTDGSKGHRKSPEDAIDKMVRQSIRSQGA